MAKAKTSKKQKSSLPDGFSEYVPSKKLLLDKKKIAEILVDSILQNDMDAFRDVLISHLRTLSKTKLAQQTGLGRQTLYDLMESENFDPRLSTLGALLSKIAA